MTFQNQKIAELDRTGLREFALTTGGVIMGLFGLFLPWVFEFDWPVWPWILGGILWITGLALPMALQPIYKLWMRFGLAISKVTTPIIMGLVFYLMITPTGLIRKLLSKDSLDRKFSDADSYRVPSVKSTASDMERPF